MSTIIVNYRFRPIVEAFEASGYNVLEDLWDPTDEQLADCEAYLLGMYDAMKRPLQTLRLKHKLSRHNIPLMTWNRDAPWHKGAKPWRLWWLKQLGVLDIYAAHSLQDSAEFAPVVVYLPNAAQLVSYNLGRACLEDMRDAGQYQWDVSFLGNIRAEKYPEMKERVRFLTELGARLARLGISYRFAHSEDMSAAEQVAIIQRSRINLSYGAACDDGGIKSCGLPERCYGVQACGGFLLSEYRRHAQDDFMIGEEWVSFDGMEDCLSKISFYLEHFDQAREIAERAHERVLLDHTYLRRAERLAEAAKRWRSARAAPQRSFGFRLPPHDQ
jgi:spore maturation protein CgeB